MFNLDYIANERNKDHNKKWSYIPDHPYRMLIIGGFNCSKSLLSSSVDKVTTGTYNFVSFILNVAPVGLLTATTAI